MKYEELCAQIDSYVERGKYRRPKNMVDLGRIFSNFWGRHRRSVVETGTAKEDLRGKVYQYFIDKFPNIRDVSVQKSVSSFSGRRKVEPKEGAFGKMGEHTVKVSNKDEKRGTKRNRDAMEDDPGVNIPPEIDDYLQPTGLFLCQPNRLQGRIPTVSFDEPVNVCKGIDPVTQKRVPRQIIDANRVRVWARQNRKNYSAQNTIMRCSAIACATAANLQVMLVRGTPLQWEWLHLCAFKLGGINGSPQQAGNLVAGTYDCNTAMITLENSIKILALEGNIFFIEVIAAMYPGTHVAMEICYRVECNDKVSETFFYPMSTDQVMKGEMPVALKLMRAFFDLSPAKKKSRSE